MELSLKSVSIKFTYGLHFTFHKTLKFDQKSAYQKQAKRAVIHFYCQLNSTLVKWSKSL